MGNSKKKIIISIAAAIVLICGITAGILLAKKNKTVNIAFYNLPDYVEKALKEKLVEVCPQGTTFTSLTESQLDGKKISKKYTFFIAEDGSAIDALSENTKPFSKSCFSEIPESIRSSGNTKLPLLLDHWELAYYVKAMENANLDFPQSFYQFEELLNGLKSQVFVPFYCNGGYDSDLLALISSITEACGGTQAYKKLVYLMKEKPELSEIIDTPLVPEEVSYVSLRNTLEILRKWVDEGLLYKNFLYAKDSDLISIGNQRQIGVFFTTLSNHREIPYEIVNRFTCDRMPAAFSYQDHSLIAPSYVCVKLCKSERFDYIMNELVNKQTQKELSAATKLAPVNQYAQCFDKQADDVRFLAAACNGGQTSDLAAAVFQTDSAAMEKFSEEIRLYLSSGKLN